MRSESETSTKLNRRFKDYKISVLSVQINRDCNLQRKCRHSTEI